MPALLNRFHGPYRLLIHVLLTGGVNKALTVFNKLRGARSSFCPASFLKTLCENEACLDEDTKLTTRPLVCLFSDNFKCDLLCFLHVVHSWMPRDRVLALLQCMSEEVEQKSWVQALICQLRRDVGDVNFEENTLFSAECEVRLKGLCEKFKAPQQEKGWELYLNEHRTKIPQADNDRNSVHRKRKNEMFTDLNIDTDLEEPKIKRMKIDLSGSEGTNCEDVAVGEEEIHVNTLQLYSGPEGGSAPGQQQPHYGPLSVLPEHIKAAVPLIKELLESETEWDESCIPVLKVLNECDPKQLEVLGGVLCLAEAPEQTLPHFCSFLLALSPDLSHSTASVIIKNLLLGKVLSLTEPASRSLVTAVTSLCSRYPRPTCQALIEPLLKEGQTGSAQAELLCRLIKDCLEPHHRLLVFEMLLKESWNEGLLSVIHALLDSKIELNEELFSLFTNQLSSQSPNFTKSVKFAKMMLTILTKFHSQVNAPCQHTLSCCISFNETFLKKSLQAALKRISH